jgi:hypothetical protein
MVGRSTLWLFRLAAAARHFAKEIEPVVALLRLSKRNDAWYSLNTPSNHLTRFTFT